MDPTTATRKTEGARVRSDGAQHEKELPAAARRYPLRPKTVLTICALVRRRWTPSGLLSLLPSSLTLRPSQMRARSGERPLALSQPTPAQGRTPR
jgi:hypothetical protein